MCLLVVFDHFQICKISLLLHITMTYIKENITKLQKLYSPLRSPRVGNKLPALFEKKSLCTGDLLPTHKIFIERLVVINMWPKLIDLTSIFCSSKSNKDVIFKVSTGEIRWSNTIKHQECIQRGFATGKLVWDPKLLSQIKFGLSPFKKISMKAL